MAEGVKSGAGGGGQTLNGAYYGISPTGTPPAALSHKLPRRRHSYSCCCCLLKLLLEIVVTLVVVLGIAALVFWLVVRPTKPKFYVETASFSQFYITAQGRLNANIDLTVTARNPNKKMGIYYDTVQARAYYEGERISWTPLPSFYQGHKNTTLLRPTLTARSLYLPTAVSDRLSEDKSNGLVDINIRLNSRVRFKLGKLKTKRHSVKVNCHISLPLYNSTTTAFAFNRQKCKVHF
eukprot:Gb_26591 [translate_table: standard]